VSGVKAGHFKGVIRKQAKSYIITGVDLDSNDVGLGLFLEELDITYRSAKFLSTRRTDCQVVQIVVNEEQSELMENPDTWPTGMSCRPWLKRSEYMQRHVRATNNADHE